MKHIDKLTIRHPLSGQPASCLRLFSNTFSTSSVKNTSPLCGSDNRVASQLSPHSSFSMFCKIPQKNMIILPRTKFYYSKFDLHALFIVRSHRPLVRSPSFKSRGRVKPRSLAPSLARLPLTSRVNDVFYPAANRDMMKERTERPGGFFSRLRSECTSFQ